MKRGIQERKVLGLDEFRSGGIQKKRVQERCRTGEKLDWSDKGRWDAGQVGCRKGRMQERRNAGKEECRKGERHEKRDAGEEGLRRREAGK